MAKILKSIIDRREPKTSAVSQYKDIPSAFQSIVDALEEVRVLAGKIEALPTLQRTVSNLSQQIERIAGNLSSLVTKTDTLDDGLSSIDMSPLENSIAQLRDELVSIKGNKHDDIIALVEKLRFDLELFKHKTDQYLKEIPKDSTPEQWQEELLRLEKRLKEYADKRRGRSIYMQGGGGAGAFVGMLDTPDSYSGESGKVVSVKATEDGLEFTADAGGDVTGPAASTDNMIARHSGTGGKTLQDYTSNPPTISDTGDMNIDGDLDVENIIVSGNVDGRDVSTDGSKLDGIEATADVTDAVNVGTSIHGVADKATPIDADKVPIIDTEAVNVLKTSSWTNIKAFLKTYFDTLYNKYVHPNHSGDVTSVADGALTIANKVTMTATAPITVSGTPTVIAGGAVAIAIPAATASVAGHATAAQITKLDGIAALADVTGSNAPQAHTASHDGLGTDPANIKDSIMLIALIWLGVRNWTETLATLGSGYQGSLFTWAATGAGNADETVMQATDALWLDHAAASTRFRMGARVMPRTTTNKMDGFFGMHDQYGDYVDFANDQYIGFRILETAGAGDYNAVLKAVSGNGTPNSTDIATGAGQWNSFDVFFKYMAGNVYFYLNGALVATHNSNLPAQLNMYPTISCTTTEAVIKTLEFRGLHMLGGAD